MDFRLTCFACLIGHYHKNTTSLQIQSRKKLTLETNTGSHLTSKFKITQYQCYGFSILMQCYNYCYFFIKISGIHGSGFTMWFITHLSLFCMKKSFLWKSSYIITITKLNLKQKYDSNKNTEKMVAINEIHDK